MLLYKRPEVLSKNATAKHVADKCYFLESVAVCLCLRVCVYEYEYVCVCVCVGAAMCSIQVRATQHPKPPTVTTTTDNRWSLPLPQSLFHPLPHPLLLQQHLT